MTITHWNYRVFRKRLGRLGQEEDELSVHEVYYEGNIPTSCSADPMDPRGGDLPQLASDLLWMAKALNKPVLEITSLGPSEVLSVAPGFEPTLLPVLFTLEDVIKVAQAVRAASASLAFPSDVAYKRSIELGGGRVRQSIENLDIPAIVSSCFNQPQQQSESDTNDQV